MWMKIQRCPSWRWHSTVDLCICCKLASEPPATNQPSSLARSPSFRSLITFTCYLLIFYINVTGQEFLFEHSKPFLNRSKERTPIEASVPFQHMGWVPTSPTSQRAPTRRHSNKQPHVRNVQKDAHSNTPRPPTHPGFPPIPDR
jgi:hypothetical protein